MSGRGQGLTSDSPDGATSERRRTDLEPVASLPRGDASRVNHIDRGARVFAERSASSRGNVRLCADSGMPRQCEGIALPEQATIEATHVNTPSGTCKADLRPLATCMAGTGRWRSGS